MRLSLGQGNRQSIMAAMAWFKLIDYEMDWDKCPYWESKMWPTLRKPSKKGWRRRWMNFRLLESRSRPPTEGDKDSHSAVTLNSKEDISPILGRFGTEDSPVIEVAFAPSIRLFVSAVPGN